MSLGFRIGAWLFAAVLVGIAAGAYLPTQVALGAGALAAAALAWIGARGVKGRLAALQDAVGQVAEGGRPHLAWQPPDPLAPLARAISDLGDELRVRLAAVHQERERLQAILHGMVEGVLVLDPAGRVLLANPRARELFGAWGEVAGRRALEVIRRAEVDEALSRAAQAPEAVVCEFQAGMRFLEMHAGRFPQQGELQGTVAVFHDVTELRHLERVRQEFVANVSHELKTPLTAIRGFAETLVEGDVDEGQQKQYLAIILRHAGRLTSLIDDLLELSRIEGRREPVSCEPLDVVSIARTVLRDLRPRLEARRLASSLDVPGPVHALADRRALEQVLLNLLDNAVKYSDEGGSVTIRVAPEARRVRITVSDTGMGIPEADRARVFERFYRVDKARSRDLGGTGLGLAIVKHLVQMMEGEVSLRSEVGKGTSFHVVLPAANVG